MKISVNGEKKVFDKEHMSVRELLDALKYKEGFAVALNTTFILNTTYETTMIKEGDALDILSLYKEAEMSHTDMIEINNDKWILEGKEFDSRMMIGSALYPSPKLMKEAIKASGAQIVTVSLRRQAGGDKENPFWDIIKSLGVQVLPNTAGCHTAQEAITTAMMAREVFGTNWVKVEVIGNQYNLQPDPFELLEATKILIKEGFRVLPYTTDDLVLAHKLVDAGCTTLMPWGSPIGSGRGLMNPYNLKAIRKQFPDLQLIVDAGIGKPSHAIQAMELGYDGILLNSAVALAHDPVQMARAFSHALTAGRLGYKAGAIQERDMASPSTPTVGTPFWHQT